MTDSEFREELLRRVEREPAALQPKPKESFGFRLFMAALVIAVIVAVAFAILNLAAPLLAPVTIPVALPTAALPPTQSAPPASSYQQPAAAPPAAPTSPPAVPTAAPIAAPPEPVTAPQAGAHPQVEPEPTKGTFGGKDNRRDAPTLRGKPRK